MQIDLIFFLPKEKINTQSLRQTSVQWWWWGWGLQSRTSGAGGEREKKERENDLWNRFGIG